MGRRLGDWDAHSGRRTVLRSEGSKAVFSYLEGLRRERDREGIADMVVVLLLFVDSRCTAAFHSSTGARSGVEVDGNGTLMYSDSLET